MQIRDIFLNNLIHDLVMHIFHQKNINLLKHNYYIIMCLTKIL